MIDDRSTGLLASVADLAEAKLALAGGADLIDLKNPAAGVLGAWPVAAVRDAVAWMAGLPPEQRRPLSATIGDLPGDLPDDPSTTAAAAAAAAAAQEMAATGVDFVKLGFFGGGPPGAILAALRPVAESGARLVGVLFADRPPPRGGVGVFAGTSLAGLMLDTTDKTEGSLRDCLHDATLGIFVSTTRRWNLLVGLAGSLSVDDIPALLPFRPDYLGFRGALTAGDRSAALDVTALARVRAAIPTS
ncbi:MAG: hypothetical protein GC191_09630 [Azospirillum sp.]|nr:hypothetical protein [Azospirillum sp.]